MSDRLVPQFPGESQSNAHRAELASSQPVSMRTFTPSQAVFASSSGCFHRTPEGRRLFDYSSGVLVANLGHNPRQWWARLGRAMGWTPDFFDSEAVGWADGVALTAYNGVTPIETEASTRLIRSLQSQTGGGRLNSVMWAASGSEAVQKSLWACIARDSGRDGILATRYGFHGKKGLAGAVTGSEDDPERDPRVRFISFPMNECRDLGRTEFDPDPYLAELDAIVDAGLRPCCLITEPYLGGGGSYHPPAAYLHLLQDFCRANDVLFVLDEVQSNFGRTGEMYAFTKYGIEPDIVCLGKGLGNGIPVSAAVGRADVFQTLSYGATSDTWSGNPLACAAVLATLDQFEQTTVLENSRAISKLFVTGLCDLKQLDVIRHVRGEGMVFGVQCAATAGRSSAEVANRIVEACYVGEGETGIHLLGPLAGDVLRVSPPLTMTREEAAESLALFHRLCARVAEA